MNIKGTKSEQNIKAAFAGESIARNKYTFYALQARNEGKNDIAELFDNMAKNEMTHAKIWFSLMHEGLGHSESNLQDAAEGENYEWKSMYPDFAKQAREDGLEELAVMFEKVAGIENQHERSFIKAYIKMKNIETTTISEQNAPVKENKTGYRCMFCGAIYDSPHDVCPVCEAIGAFEFVEIDD